MNPSRPTSALAALSAYVKARLPSVHIKAMHEHLVAAERLDPIKREPRFLVFWFLIGQAYEAGELIYAAMLHPERRGPALDRAAELLDQADFKNDRLKPGNLFPTSLYGAFGRTWRGEVEIITRILERHLDDLAERLARDYDVVGSTASVGQTFGSLALCQRLKRLRPDIKTVIGGPSLSVGVGPSMMLAYDNVDYMVQGEGERPFVALLERIMAGTPADDIRGVVTRANAALYPTGAPLWEVENMDDLPTPDFDDYAELAERLDVRDWVVSLEGSRGCWWDRTKRTGNAKKTCYFCNLNVSWDGYRQKTGQKIASEIVAIQERYGDRQVFFVDNIIRQKGIPEFAEALRTLPKRLNFAYEMRVSISPREFLLLVEAGMSACQFGIEGLSTNYLRKIGKGTLVIQNLLSMKLCQELEVQNDSNLLCDFPGSTDDDVLETCRNIDDFAHMYEPLSNSPFWLGSGSTVEVLRKEFPVTNIRNDDIYKVAVPEEIFEKIQTFNFSYDPVGTKADWTPFLDCDRRWRELQKAAKEKKSHVRWYDHSPTGGITIREFDAPGPVGEIGPADFELFLYLGKIRTFDELTRHFPNRDQTALRATLDEWAAAKWVIREGSRYLVTIPAATRKLAAWRIKNFNDDERSADACAPAPAAKDEIPLAAAH